MSKLPDIDKPWTREELRKLTVEELTALIDEVDDACIGIDGHLTSAKARYKQRGEESDPEWLASLNIKLQHMKRKRQMLQEVRAEERRNHFMQETVNLAQSGFGGIMPDGSIVDRRDYPKAIPMQKNPLFGIPKPQALTHASDDKQGTT